MKKIIKEHRVSIFIVAVLCSSFVFSSLASKRKNRAFKEKQVLSQTSNVSPAVDIQSYSQNIFARKDLTPPESTLLYENPDIDSGLVIILGKRMEELIEDKIHLEILGVLDIDLKRDMEIAHAAHSVNILYMNLHNARFDLANIEEAIRGFSKKNKKISIISMIHGSVSFPWVGSHRLYMGPELQSSDNFIRRFASRLAGYFIPIPAAGQFVAGQFIESSKLFKAISDAVGDKPIKMWKTSCQGNKTIEDAQKILPKNSILVTESKGWVERPDYLLYALSRILRSGKDFDFQSLLVNYAYTSNLFEKHFKYSNYYDDTFGYYKHFYSRHLQQVFNIDPIYTLIGGKSISLIDGADEFLAKCRSGEIDSKEIQQVLDKLSNLIVPDKDDFLAGYIADLKKTIEDAMVESAILVKDCTLHLGEGSYITEAILEGLGYNPKTLEDALIKSAIDEGVPIKDHDERELFGDKCKLNWDQYMSLICLSAATVEEKKDNDRGGAEEIVVEKMEDIKEKKRQDEENWIPAFAGMTFTAVYNNFSGSRLSPG